MHHGPVLQRRELERPTEGNHNVTQPCWDPSHCNTVQPQCGAQEEPRGTEPRKARLLLLREPFVIFKGWEPSHSPWRSWLLHLVAVITTRFHVQLCPAASRSAEEPSSQCLPGFTCLRTSVREGPRPAPCSSPPRTHFGLAGLAKAREQLLMQGEPPQGCTAYLEAKQRARRRSRPSPSRLSPSAQRPRAPPPPCGGHISSLCCCFPAAKLPERAGTHRPAPP